MFAGHGRGSDGRDDIGEGLVRADDGRWGVVIVVAGEGRIFGRVGAVEVIGVGGEGAQADGHAGGLEAGRVERDDADGVVAVGLQVLDGDGGFLGGDVANVYAVDADYVFEDRGALVWRLPVQQHAIGLDASERDEGRDGDFEAEDLHQLLDGLREDLVGAEGDPACAVSVCACISAFLYFLPEERRDYARRAQPARRREQEGLHVIAGDIGRPVQRRSGFGEHGDRCQASPTCLSYLDGWVKFARCLAASCAATTAANGRSYRPFRRLGCSTPAPPPHSSCS